MIKKNKYISLPLAKELQKVAKENGFELPESEHKWVEILEKGIEPNWHLVGDDEKPEDYCFVEGDQMGRIIKAFDVSELGEMLPYKFSEKIGVSRCFYWLKMKKMDNQFGVAYFADNPKSIGIEETEKTEVEARGKMLLYLIKNKLIKEL